MRATGWRRIATAVWDAPRDPQIYGRLEIDAEPLTAAVEAIRARTGAHVTLTHLVARALGLALREHPWMNTRLVAGRFLPRRGADVFVIAATPGADLSGVIVRDADRKTAAQIAQEVSARVDALRRGDGGELDAAKHAFAALPAWLLRPVLAAGAFLTNDLGLDLSKLGMPRESFGGAMVSNVGVFGLPEGYAPLAALYRVPVCMLVGEVERRPWVDGDRVVPHPVLPVTATIDHRWVDGAGVAAFAKSVRAYLADPLAFEYPRTEVTHGRP